MASERDQVITIQEAAQYLRVPLSSLYKLAQRGELPCQKIGRHWRFRREAMDRWLEGGQKDDTDRRRQDDG